MTKIKKDHRIFKIQCFLAGLGLLLSTPSFCQKTTTTMEKEQEIHRLIDSYSQARTEKDTSLLMSILTVDIDQLVSSGKWRKGKAEALKGMMQSSESNPGSRKLTVESVRFLNAGCALADARYVIQNTDGSERKMWSTFIVIQIDSLWKIAAIRNMLPAASQ